MNALKQRIVVTLVGLYPARWRSEYGAELADLLLRRSLGPAAVLDVIWNALVQQLRLGEPWLIMGLPVLALTLQAWVRNILFPGPYVSDSLRSSWIQQLFSAAVIVTVGCWTVLRDPRHGRGGRAAIRFYLCAAWPLPAIALLAGLGIVKVIVLGPGDPPTTFHEHGLAITLYDHARRPFGLLGLFVIPFIGIPEVWLLGALAARLTRAGLRRWRAQT